MNAVDAPSQTGDEVAEAIHRCAAAAADLSQLRQTLQALRHSSDIRAQFATALFDLERARRGDAEARTAMLGVADALLIFWRDQSGHRLAREHPTLERLWAQAASLLVKFESKRLEQTLASCWESRSDAALLQRAVAELSPDGQRRVEFARCLYHLELARLFVAPSRAEFSARVELLTEAYQDAEVARALIGDDVGLKHLWDDLLPYLDEFFEHLEQGASFSSEPSGLHAVPLGESKPIPSFRSLLGPETGGTRAPPPPPSDLTPPGAWRRPSEFSKAPEPGPAPHAVDAAAPVGFASRPSETDALRNLDIVEACEPLSAAPTPTHGLPSTEVDLDFDEEPGSATLEFWMHTFSKLRLVPDPDSASVETRLLASDTRAERKRLTEYLLSIDSYAAVPEARAFACLIRLCLAAKTKEKGLFGQANPVRQEAVQNALCLLSAHPQAAGHAAVWFEFDGQETRQALAKGLDILIAFIAFCSRSGLDPLNPLSAERFATGQSTRSS